MGESTKVGISADRIVALITALLMVGVGLDSILTTNLLIILFSIISILLGLFLIAVLNVFEVDALRKLPYGLWVLAAISAVLILICVLGGVLYDPENPANAVGFLALYLLPTVLIVCATLINVLSEKQSYVPSKLVVLAGAGFAIAEAVVKISLAEGLALVGAIFIGIFGIILAAILIISMSEKIPVPFAWWLVLIIGFIFFWIFKDLYTFGWSSGIIILVGFILMIFAY